VPREIRCRGKSGERGTWRERGGGRTAYLIHGDYVFIAAFRSQLRPTAGVRLGKPENEYAVVHTRYTLVSAIVIAMRCSAYICRTHICVSAKEIRLEGKLKAITDSIRSRSFRKDMFVTEEYFSFYAGRKPRSIRERRMIDEWQADWLNRD